MRLKPMSVTCLTLFLIQASLCRAQELEIDAFHGNGELSWTHGETSGFYTVEWVPEVDGTWDSSWDALVEIPATGGATQVQVPMFYRAVWNSNDQAVVVGTQSIGTGNGVTANFNGILGHTPIVPGTVVVASGSFSLVDNGNGGLSGDGSGTINYQTGAIVANFTLAPSVGSDVLVTYHYRKHGGASEVLSYSESIGTGNGVNATFSTTLNQAPVVPRSVVVTAGQSSFTDDGNGVLSGGGAGTVSYQTGAIVLSFSLAPGVGNDVVVTYRSPAPGSDLQYQYEPVGVGNGATATFEVTLSHRPVARATLLIRDDVEVFEDFDITGTIMGNKGGVATLDYDSGQLSVTFWHAPAIGQSIMAGYFGVAPHMLNLSASPNPIPNGQNQSVISVVSGGTSPYTWSVEPPGSGTDANGSIATLPANSATETYQSVNAGANLVRVTDNEGRVGTITITQEYP